MDYSEGMSCKQGKVVSDTKIYIAANRILEKYAVGIHGSTDANMRLQKSSGASTPESTGTKKFASRLRLDRLDRSIEVQNACESFDMENPETFKKSCGDVEISPATFSYLLYTLSRKEPILNLRNLRIGPTGAILVVHKLMKEKPTVIELDISSNNLGDSGIASICNFLATNDTVVKVDFSRNSVQRAGADAISNMLVQNRKIKTIILSNNALSEEDFELAAYELQTDQTLENLDLSSNSFTSKSGHIFSCLFAKNVSLATFNLSSNCIGDQGIRDLIPGLKGNGTVRNLDLSWNNIGDEGVAWIAEFLIINNVLRKLNLSYNRISNKGIKCLADSLSINGGLECMELSGNSLCCEGAVVLLQAILKNSSSKLSRLYLGEVTACPELNELFNEIQSRNKAFEAFGIFNAAGQAIKLKPRKNALRALDNYIVKNNLYRRASLFDLLSE